MNWIEMEIVTKSEGVDAISSILFDAGITGFQIEDDYETKKFIEENSSYWDYIDENFLSDPSEDTKIRLYIADDEFGKEKIIQIKNEIKRFSLENYGLDFGTLEIHLKNVDDSTWLENWKKYYKPFRVGKNIIVKPTWEDCDKNKNDLIFNINPGNVFGTGLHQSTKMCIVAIEDYVKKGYRVADLGCGSGILSIISIMLGANYAYACDIESHAYDVAYENASLNNIFEDKYKVEIGNILDNKKMLDNLSKNKFDVVIANIIADVIIDLSLLVPNFIKKNGIFIASGIIKERLDEVIENLKSNGFDILKTATMEEWTSCISVYNGKS